MLLTPTEGDFFLSAVTPYQNVPNHLTTWAFQNRQEHLLETLVCIKYHLKPEFHADKQTIEQLAPLLGISTFTVRRYIKSLVNMGWIGKSKSGRLYPRSYSNLCEKTNTDPTKCTRYFGEDNIVAWLYTSVVTRIAKGIYLRPQNKSQRSTAKGAKVSTRLIADVFKRNAMWASRMNKKARNAGFLRYRIQHRKISGFEYQFNQLSEEPGHVFFCKERRRFYRRQTTKIFPNTMEFVTKKKRA
jgi:hypothetical protein